MNTVRLISKQDLDLREAFKREGEPLLRILTCGGTYGRSGGYQANDRRVDCGAQALPDELRGNGFGVLSLTQALGDLGSTAVVGIIWAVISPATAFGYAAAWMRPP